MLAAVLKEFNRLVLEDVPTPRPGPGQALVRIKSCGFCATDFKAIKGIRQNVKFPLVPGHEPAGIVVGVGVGVTHIREGDEVIIQPSGYCGLCHYCRLGLTHYCEHAYTTGGDGPEDVWHGSFAEYTLTGANTLFKKPKNISFDAACEAEPVSGAWKGVIQRSQMSLGDDVVVIGTGAIGMYCLMVAKAAGAGRLIAIDVSDYALETAKRLGATHTINPNRQEARTVVYDILPHGPDLVIEAAGPIQAVKLMVSFLRRGTRWNIFGITTHEKFELDGGLIHFLEALHGRELRHDTAGDGKGDPLDGARTGKPRVGHLPPFPAHRDPQSGRGHGRREAKQGDYQSLSQTAKWTRINANEDKVSKHLCEAVAIA